MNCPKCQTTMRERERESGREVVVMDVCPNCGGLFLDKGELEKLTIAENRYYDDDYDRDRGRDDDRDRYRRDEEYYRRHPQKKKSFLSSMMESFGGGDD